MDLKPVISREDFVVLLSKTGLPLDAVRIEALHEGYALLQQLTASLHRPASLETDLALSFTPEPVR